MEDGGQLQGRSRKDALTANWRRPGKQLGMPVPNYDNGFNERRGGAKIDQDDQGSRHRYWGGCVHDDAQRATVGVALDRMDVRHLHHGQQRQQGKTHHSGQGQSARL